MILVFGTVCLDRIRHVARIPAFGEYVEVDSEVLMLGGEAANTAANLARWGADLRLLGNSLAEDLEGVLLESLLVERGLGYPTRSVAVKSTPVCDVYVTPDGERTMFGLGFSTMSAPDPAELDTLKGSWFTVDGNFGAVGEAYASRATEGGMGVYLMDLPPTSTVIGSGTLWHSSTRWYGERGNSAVNEGLVRELVERTGCTAILSDAGRGLMVGTPEGVRNPPVFERPEVRDSTGAGDTLRAGVLFGLDRGWRLGKCLSFGSAAASLAAGFVGASEGPTLAAVEAHLAAHPDIVRQYD